MGPASTRLPLSGWTWDAAAPAARSQSPVVPGATAHGVSFPAALCLSAKRFPAMASPYPPPSACFCFSPRFDSGFSLPGLAFVSSEKAQKQTVPSPPSQDMGRAGPALARIASGKGKSKNIAVTIRTNGPIEGSAWSCASLQHTGHTGGKMLPTINKSPARTGPVCFGGRSDKGHCTSSSWSLWDEQRLCSHSRAGQWHKCTQEHWGLSPGRSRVFPQVPPAAAQAPFWFWKKLPPPTCLMLETPAAMIHTLSLPALLQYSKALTRSSTQ